MIDHIGINVQDIDAAKRFYDRALEPLGYTAIREFPEGVGYGERGKPDFWIMKRGDPSPTHVALASPDRATVDAFYGAALAAGGEDNGPPGLRPLYHETYYGAYVHDPDGNNIEAVCHSAE